MIVVDSGTWADFFNGTSAPHLDRLDAALGDEEDLAVLPIIITEFLQGFRAARSFRQGEGVLVVLPVIQPTVACHDRAARLFRSLRKRGITVRGAIDCIIVRTCLDLGAELLSPDVDFEQIVRRASLRPWLAASSGAPLEEVSSWASITLLRGRDGLPVSSRGVGQDPVKLTRDSRSGERR